MVMTNLKRITLGLILLFVAACSTPYGPKGPMGGYIDSKVGEDKFHIEFIGNGYTTVGQVEEYFYQRANEVCQQNGFDSYNVVDAKSGMESQFAGLRPTARGVVQCYKKNQVAVSQSPAAPSSAISLGTGWVSETGFIVTNYHVVQGSSKIFALLPNKEKIECSIKAFDSANDLAILKPKTPGPLPAGIPLGDLHPDAGAHVFTIGYPHPDLMGSAPKVTDGIINSVTGFRDDIRTYQISVALQSGNSGGPLVTMDGKVVGIVTSKLNAIKVFKWTGDLPENVNYAVKVDYLKALISASGNMAPESASSHAAAKPLEEIVSQIKPSVVIIIAE